MPTRTLFVVSLIALCASPLSAQTTSPSTRLGLGVALNTSGSDLVPAFEVPIDIGSHLRVQPEFRYRRQHDAESDSATIGGRPISQTIDDSTSETWFGTAVLYTARQDRLMWHAGAKIGLARTASDLRSSMTGVPGPDVSQSASSNGYFVGPVFGGEYFLHDRFSLGVSIAIVYQSNDLNVPNMSASIVTSTVSHSQLDTVAAVTARIYLR